LLADNRHYTFYIWNRFYARHPLAPYLPIPVYFVALLNICLILFAKRNRHSINFPLFYFVCTTASIALQKLIEIRYFILPFLVLRLLQKHSMPLKYLALEFVFNLTLNIITFYVFFTKEIRWSDYTDIQRLIW
jgi:alpha-1,2-glucosyltransferase